jgi:hypothetical protein
VTHGASVSAGSNGSDSPAIRPDSPALPRIRRARGFRLYGADGRRYLDLWRDGALLGYRAAGTLTAMKAALSQGLTGPFPAAGEARLCGALARLLPEWPVVRLFSSRERALAAAAALLGRPVMALCDPALGDEGLPASAASATLGAAAPASVAPASVALWRPFLPAVPGALIVLPVLPFTLGGAPAALCVPADMAAGLPASDAIPGFILGAAVRGLAALTSAREIPRLGSPALERALDAARGWRRAGPYVRAEFPAEDYPRVRERFLRAGVLLCPGYPGPSILPGECSPGETRLLAECFAGIPGG